MDAGQRCLVNSRREGIMLGIFHPPQRIQWLVFKLSQHNITAQFSTVNAIKTDQPTLPTKNPDIIYSSWEKLWCALQLLSPCTEHTMRRADSRISSERQNWICWAETVGFSWDFSGFVASWANPQICYSSQQAPRAAISNSEAHRVQTQSLKREITNILPRLGCGDPIVKMMVTLVIIIGTSPQMWSK